MCACAIVLRLHRVSCWRYQKSKIYIVILGPGELLDRGTDMVSGVENGKVSGARAHRRGRIERPWQWFTREFTQSLTAIDKGGATIQTKLTILLHVVGLNVNDMQEMIHFGGGKDRTKWLVVC